MGRREGMPGVRGAISLSSVVPAKAGTHSHRQMWLRGLGVATSRHNLSLGLWVPAFAGTTVGDLARTSPYQ
ncbi:hypothetical protein ABIB73_005519 [Bradyrhizobium sp. F1.4.3]